MLNEIIKSHSKCNTKYKQDEIIQILDLNIFVQFGRLVFQQTTYILMNTTV